MTTKKRPGFRNIQIQGKIELADLFEDTFQQSGCNSKGEFLNVLLDDFLNPEEAISKKAEDVEKEKNQIEYTNNLLEEEKHQIENQLDTALSDNIEKDETIEMLQEKIDHYENDMLHSLLNKHKGKRLKFKSTKGEKVEIQINSIEDVYTAIINSIKV